MAKEYNVISLLRHLLTSKGSIKYYLMKRETIELHTEQQVFNLLEDTNFQAKWDDLFTACPSATIFQSRSFVHTWYKIYHNKYLPIVITTMQDGRLTGLLTLAKQGKMIRFAGADQAEYCIWVTEEHNKESFIMQALQLVRKLYPHHSIYFKYLPENTPLNWINQIPWKHYCILKTFKQPLLKIDLNWSIAKLKRRSRKNEINKLKSKGTLSFERITDYEQFAAVLDELIILYDFRKGAVYNQSQFRQDTRRKEFFLALFKEKLLHATLLKVNNTIVAASVYTIEGNKLYAKGLSTHAPEFAQLSPGMLHKILLNKMLAEEAFEMMDLTPGGETYKDDLASHYGQVYVLTVSTNYLRLTNLVRSRFSQYLKKGIESLARKNDIEYSQLKKLRWNVLYTLDKLKTIRKQSFTTTVKLLVSQVQSVINPKIQKYISYAEVAKAELGEDILLQKNSLRDLLAFDDRGTLISRWQFLRNAMKRLENNETVYTWSKKGHLIGCVWLTENKVIDSDALQLEGIYIHFTYRKRIAEFLKAIIDKIKQENMHSQLCALTTSSDKLLQKTFIDMGFKKAV